MKKTWYYSIGLLIGLAIMVVEQLPAESAKMVVCDVGQGDAILIIKGSNQVLIDGGPSTEKINSCLENHLPFWDRKIELIVLTNTDFDHMNGLSSVVDRYSVMQFVTADGVKDSEALDKFRDALRRNGVRVQAVERGDRINIRSGYTQTDLIFEVMWPPDTKAENVAIFGDQMDKSKREQILGASAKAGDVNDRSVALLLLEDKKTVFLGGDIGDQAEKQLIEMQDLPDIDILKVGHHGSKYASTMEFLDKIKPELAVISVGSKNTYGHPTQETLDRLSKVGAIIRRTDQEGTVVIDL